MIRNKEVYAAIQTRTKMTSDDSIVTSQDRQTASNSVTTHFPLETAVTKMTDNTTNDYPCDKHSDSVRHKITFKTAFELLEEERHKS